MLKSNMSNFSALVNQYTIGLISDVELVLACQLTPTQLDAAIGLITTPTGFKYELTDVLRNAEVLDSHTSS